MTDPANLTSAGRRRSSIKVELGMYTVNRTNVNSRHLSVDYYFSLVIHPRFISFSQSKRISDSL